MSETAEVPSRKRKFEEASETGESKATEIPEIPEVPREEPIVATPNAESTSIVDIEKANFIVDCLPNERIIEIFMKVASNVPGVVEFLKEASLEEITTRKIFVRGLTWDTTVADVNSVFSTYGTIVDCTVVVDKNTGYSKGYGFVTFQDVDSVYNALKESKKLIKGQETYCNIATKNEKSKSMPNESSATNSSKEATVNRKLFVRSIPWDCTTEVLSQAFAGFGIVEDCHIAMDRATGKTKGYGFVTMSADAEASAAVAYSGHNVGGRNVFVSIASLGVGRSKNTGGGNHGASMYQQQAYNSYQYAHQSGGYDSMYNVEGGYDNGGYAGGAYDAGAAYDAGGAGYYGGAPGYSGGDAAYAGAYGGGSYGGAAAGAYGGVSDAPPAGGGGYGMPSGGGYSGGTGYGNYPPSGSGAGGPPMS